MRSARDRLEETVARLDSLLEHASFGFAFVDHERAVRPRERGVRRGHGPDAGRARRPAGRRARPRARPTVLRAPGPDATGDGAELLRRPGRRRHRTALARRPVSGAQRRRPRARCRASWPSTSPSGSGASGRSASPRRRASCSPRPGRADLLDRMAAIAIPEFADMCVLYVAPRAGLPAPLRRRRTCDAGIEAELRAIEARWPQDLDRMWAAIGAGPALLVADVTPEQRRAFTSGDPEEAEFAEDARCRVGDHRAVAVGDARPRAHDVRVHRRVGSAVPARRHRAGDRARQPVRRADRERVPRARGGTGAVAPRPARGGERAPHRRPRHPRPARRHRARRCSRPSPTTARSTCPSDAGGLGLAAYATTDASVRDRVATLDVVGIHDLEGDAPPAVVMRTGEPMLIGAVTPEVVAQLGDAEYAGAPRWRGRTSGRS